MNKIHHLILYWLAKNLSNFALNF